MKNKLIKTLASALCATLLLASTACNKQTQTSTGADTPIAGTEELGTVAGAYLYRNGVSEYSILIPDDANDYETLAAQELQQNLLASTGNSIAIVTKKQLKNANRVISLGHTYLWDQNVGKTLSRDNIIDSGYYITTVGKNIFIFHPVFD